MNWYIRNNLDIPEQCSTRDFTIINSVLMKVYGVEVSASFMAKALNTLEGKDSDYEKGQLAGRSDYYGDSNQNKEPLVLLERIEEVIESEIVNFD